MATNALFVFCVLLMKAALSQCLNRESFFPCNFGCPPGIEIISTSGGNLPITSSSIKHPTGLVVTSENVYEGRLATTGELPFVGTASVDSILPTAGAGAVKYGCGNGFTDLYTKTSPAAAAFSTTRFTDPLSFAPAAAIAPFAPTAAFGLATPSCGCGAFY